MKEAQSGMDRQERVWTLAAWALLVFAPWIQLLVISLVIGKNALTTYPVWSDELDFWRSLFSWVNVGFSSGFNGIGEYPTAIGTLSIRGITPILLYGGWSKLFGLTHYSIPLFNALWMSLAGLVFCILLKPRARVAALVAGLFMVYMPALLYTVTSMTEGFNYALMLFYYALLCYRIQTGRKWAAILCWGLVTLGCVYRITYVALFLPLVAVGSGLRFSKKSIGLGALALMSAALAYATAVYISAPNPSGFLSNWLRAESLGIFVQMFFSHAKSNLQDYFLHTGSPMEDTLRCLYCLAMAWTLIGSFVRMKPKEEGRGVRFGMSFEYLACFLLLFVPFVIVVIMYETNDWTDFRILSPFLWGVAVWLILRSKKALPMALLAGSAAALVWLCTLAPVGAFSDEGRFISPEFSPEVQAACQAIIFDAEAENPYANTIRTDLMTFQVMQEVDPAMGLWTGWFTQKNTGKSRWVLTDHLKIMMEGYSPVYTDRGAKVYRRIGDYTP